MNNLDAVLPSEIYYDRVTKRYRYSGGVIGSPIKGTFISRPDIINLQKKFLNTLTKDFINLAPKILSGQIGAYKEAAEILKKIHMSNAVIKAGGIDKLSQSSLGSIGNVLKNQYYRGIDDNGQPFGLKYLLKDATGNPPLSERMLRYRLEMYAKSGEISGHIAAQNVAKDEGKTEVKRLLNPGENCPDCIRYASLGWNRLIDKILPFPKTMCVCRANCNCDMIYR